MLGNSFMCRKLIHTHHKHLFLTLKTVFVIFIICPLWRPRGISQLVSGLYYVTRDTGCNIHIGAKLYSLGRAKVFSSVATNFRLKTMELVRVKKEIKSTLLMIHLHQCQKTRFILPVSITFNSALITNKLTKHSYWVTEVAFH